MSPGGGPDLQLSGPETDDLVRLLCDAYVEVARQGARQPGDRLLDMIEFLRYRQHGRAGTAMTGGQPR
jgi:hypothetical protein